MHTGAAALLWGEPAAAMHASVFLLAGSVLPAWGEPAPPRLAPWGKRERGIGFLAAAGDLNQRGRAIFRVSGLIAARNRDLTTSHPFALFSSLFWAPCRLGSFV